MPRPSAPVSNRSTSMSSTGTKFLGGYFAFLLRWVRVYVILCILALIAVFITDRVRPELKVYRRIHEAVVGLTTPAAHKP